MKELYKGHRYKLNHLDGAGSTILQFVQRKPFHEPKEGVINQEVIRALIARVKHLDKETPWELNKQIIHHLEMALVLHEARALIRKAEKGELNIERIAIRSDGHFKYRME